MPEYPTRGNIQGLGAGLNKKEATKNNGMVMDNHSWTAADSTPASVSTSSRSRLRGSGDRVVQDRNELFGEPAKKDPLAPVDFVGWVFATPLLYCSLSRGY